jgi:hypothetical protein
MRTKLLPERVDRTIRDTRDQAVGRVMRRFRKSTGPAGANDPPPTPET